MDRVGSSASCFSSTRFRQRVHRTCSPDIRSAAGAEDLAHGDTQALSAFLSLTRVVGKADFTFWARAYQDIVEITGHLGAKHSGFGFALPLGRGVGGRIAAYGTPIVGDYRNSPYRDPSVCDIIDGEDIRSGLALPVRYHAGDASNPRVAAVLYVTRRTTTPFSLSERLLVQRLAGLIEPLPSASRPPSFVSKRHGTTLSCTPIASRPSKHGSVSS